MMNRRNFLKSNGALAGLMALGGIAPQIATRAAAANAPYKISLAEWSLHQALFGGKMTNLDFPVMTKKEFGIDAVEFVNQFFKDKARDRKYLADLKSRCDGEGVQAVLIMCDGEGNLGDPDNGKRSTAVENHYKWVSAAWFLGCHSIRVNAATGNAGSYDDQMSRAADGLHRLSEYAAQYDINVIVENHGALSSNGAWLAGVMKKVNLPNCGTLPDFGNFNLGNGEMYDRYKGVEELMPFAKAVSAKSHDFDACGNEIHTDYRRMMKLVLAAGYHGYVGIEYEGNKVSEPEGIKLTKKLLETVRAELA